MQRIATRAGSSLPALDRLGRRPALDGLRAIAALIVVGVHSDLGFVRSGTVGVQIFFVLSGFLITSVLLEQMARGRFTFGGFIDRRARRLLPAYFVVVVACVLIEQVSPMGGTDRGAVFGFFYVANWVEPLTGHGLGLLTHTWALQIEEQFYLLWPLALAAIVVAARGRLARIAVAVVALAAVSVAMRFVLWGAGVSWMRIENGTDTRIADLLFGCALGVVLARSRTEYTGRAARVWSVAGVAAFALLLACITFSVETNRAVTLLWKWPFVTALALVAITAIVTVPTGALTRFLSNRPLAAVAEVSYGLFLWHFPILAVLDQHFGLQHLWVKLLGWSLTAVAAVLSYRFIEQPALRMRFTRRNEAAASAATASS